MKENFVDRLLKFVDEHGGVYEVAESIDVSPQTFYTMKRRNSLPNLSLIYALKERYTNLDLNWLLLGKKQDQTSSEVAELKERLRRSEAIVDTLTGISKKHKGATICPSVDRKHRKAATSYIMRLAHRPAKKLVLTPGRVLLSPMQTLLAGYGQGVRMQ